MAFPSGIVDALEPQRLRLLVELGRRGSISAAAEACRMGQPSATKHLKTLEAAVGEKLVRRNGRASALTEAGEVVALHAQRVLDTLDGMQEELRALRDAESGTLTLAASTTPGSYVLPLVLECFAERHPRVGVDLVIGASGWVAERVARREVSLGLAGEVEWPDGVVAEPWLHDEVVGIVAPGRLELRRGPVAVERLVSETLLVREPGSSTRSVAERYLARVGYRPKKRWELDSDEAIKRSVRAGLGVGFVSRLVVTEELERGELEAFEVEGAGSMQRSVFPWRSRVALASKRPDGTVETSGPRPEQARRRRAGGSRSATIASVSSSSTSTMARWVVKRSGGGAMPVVFAGLDDDAVAEAEDLIDRQRRCLMPKRAA